MRVSGLAASFQGGVSMSEAMNAVVADDAANRLLVLVQEIVRSLVDDASVVSVEAVADGEGTLFRLRVAEGEVGKVIGRQGRTARSLRTILSAAGMKLHRRFSLDIIEDSGHRGAMAGSDTDAGAEHPTDAQG